MRRVLSSGMQKAAYTASARALAEPAVATAAHMTLNFNTPHAAVVNKKLVEQVVLPGAAGVFAVTQGHSPIISQLEPGVVTVVHVGVSFFGLDATNDSIINYLGFFAKNISTILFVQRIYAADSTISLEIRANCFVQIISFFFL